MTATPHDDGPEALLEEVSEGVFAYVQPDGSWGLNNPGFLVGEDGVLAIDTCFTERRTRAFLDAIRTVTDRSVRTLVNTHHHGDHTHGNGLLAAATIIGHERCRERMQETGLGAKALFPDVEWGELAVAPPVVTFRDRLDIHVDDLRVEAMFVGPAHTDNDVVYWVPERRVLFCGDLMFNGGTPFVLMGSVEGSIDAVERLRGLEAETIVPGHGPVCGPEVWDDVVGYLTLVRDAGDQAREAGQSPLEAARDLDLGPYADRHNPERVVGNLHRLYAERAGAAPGATLDYPRVFADMLEWNGGQPLRCLA